MPNSGLLLALFFAVSLTLTGGLLGARAGFEAAGKRTGGVLSRLLGEGRRMFSNHFFLKADAYFHRGNSPSVFEERRHEEDHMTQGTPSEHHEGETPEEHAAHAKEAEHPDPNQPRDWIAAFNRRLKPSAHVHLEAGDEREMLPWLKLSAELDPHRIETYTVAAYWLRMKLGKVNEAEQFLREGLRENPGSYEILLELARVLTQRGRDLAQIRSILELALNRWNQNESTKEKPDVIALGQILGALADAEEKADDLPGAIQHLERLKQVSPQPGAIQLQIDDLRSRIVGAAK